MCFNKWGGCPSEINLKMQRKMSVLGLFFRFFSALRLDFELFFLRIFLLVWHLWQQKFNIAVGMRARTRVREKEKHNDAVFCHLHYAKRWCRKMFCHFFLDFSLFGAISTHILIGAGWTYVAHMWYGRNKENNERTMKRGSEGVAKIREKVRERKRACVWVRAKKLHLNNQTQLKTKNKESESLSCWLMEMEESQNSIWRSSGAILNTDPQCRAHPNSLV